MELLPNSLGEWLYLLIGVGGAIAALFSRRRKETNETEDRLIDLLKDQVDAQDRKIKDLERAMAAHRLELDSLTQENEVMKKVLQGRDQATLEFQKQGFEAMKTASQLLAIAQTSDKKITDLMGMLGRYLQSVDEKLNA